MSTMKKNETQEKTRASANWFERFVSRVIFAFRWQFRWGVVIDEAGIHAKTVWKYFCGFAVGAVGSTLALLKALFAMVSFPLQPLWMAIFRGDRLDQMKRDHLLD